VRVFTSSYYRLESEESFLQLLTLADGLLEAEMNATANVYRLDFLRRRAQLISVRQSAVTMEMRLYVVASESGLCAVLSMVSTSSRSVSRSQ
jgi:hypothetical protein